MLPLVDASLRPAACPRCDYPLDGLPAVGTCPECGRGYDGSVLYLYGHNLTGPWRRPAWSNRRLAWDWGLFALTILPWWVLGLDRFGAVMMTLMFGWMPALATVRRLTVRAGDRAATAAVRVRLGPDGVGQGGRGLGPIPFEAADRATPVPWAKVWHVAVTASSPERVRITMSPDHGWFVWRSSFVSADVEWPADRADELRRRVQRWRAAR